MQLTTAWLHSTSNTFVLMFGSIFLKKKKQFPTNIAMRVHALLSFLTPKDDRQVGEGNKIVTHSPSGLLFCSTWTVISIRHAGLEWPVHDRLIPLPLSRGCHTINLCSSLDMCQPTPTVDGRQVFSSSKLQFAEQGLYSTCIYSDSSRPVRRTTHCSGGMS